MPALEVNSLDARPQEFRTVLGPSRCGKCTLLVAEKQRNDALKAVEGGTFDFVLLGARRSFASPGAQ